jgi:hypothetical protein
MGIKVDTFAGMVPRIPANKLPPSNASAAQNCDFAYGELRNTKADTTIKSMSNAAQSVYTDNGLTFYSWTEEVDAVRSPLANDTFDRLYYTTVSDFRVAPRSGMSTSGGAPTNSYRVGVPAPTVAPTLAGVDTPGLDTATLTATFYYESDGVRYQEQNIPLVQVKPLEQWTITPPARNVWVAPTPTRNANGEYNPYPSEPPQYTPKEASAVVRLVAKSKATGAVLMDAATSFSTSDNNGWNLALTQDSGSSNMTLTLAKSTDAGDQDTRAYAYTYVNTYNEEGPPSPAATVTISTTQAVTIGVTRDASVSAYAPIKEIRVYRTAGSSGSDYFYVASVQVLQLNGTAFTFTDDVDGSGLNEPLASFDYYPPNPALSGLLMLPNGIMMAWKGNELHFSDAYKPWSWPPAYVKTFPDCVIVGAMAIGSGALVTTTSRPFMISGVSPDSMTEMNLNVMQAGASKYAMANLGGGLVYASHDGIVSVTGGTASLDLSNQFFTRDVWRAKYGLGLSSMRFEVWDGRLIVYSPQNLFTPFMLGLDETKGAMTEIPAFRATCSFTSPLTDLCYFVSGTTLYSFSGGTDATASWTSAEFQTPRPVNYGCIQVDCTGSWKVEVYAGLQATPTSPPVMTLKHTQTGLTGYATFPLPSGFMSDRWQFVITGTGAFKQLRVAENQKAMKLL